MFKFKHSNKGHLRHIWVSIIGFMSKDVVLAEQCSIFFPTASATNQLHDILNDYYFKIYNERI